MTPKNSLPAVCLLVDSAHGVYVPRSFCTNFDLTKWAGIDQADVDIILSENAEGDLLSPYEIEAYWDAWQEILDSATFTENGNVWRLNQDGDLWALCYELMTNEERSNFEMELDPTHEYYINLDERGEFYADVRTMAGETVFEMHGFDIFNDGFMSDKNDIDGLTKYLKDNLLIGEYDIVEKA